MANTNTSESWKNICQGINPSLAQEMNGENRKEDEKSLEESAKIGSYMKTLMMRYEDIRGQTPVSVFWDLVVISAGDEEQRSWYEAQLELKQEAGDLPLVQYLIVPDPPGPRIGSGGSTLHILTKLSTMYGDKLDSWRVLLIHAGGYSKRLPSHSCSGKIFSPLPIQASRGGPYQMLDLKLAMYLPFLSMMQAGVFVTASDDIEVYNMDPDSLDSSLMSGECVTALAHPSSMYIGTTHGVYVMPESAANMQQQTLQTLSPCEEVLQKPSVDLMRERRAVMTSTTDQETVYSDSAFWFHVPTSHRLIKLYQDLGSDIKVETCIYGDFLTCLGNRKDKHYLEHLYKCEDRPDVSVKKKINEHVGDTRLNILSLHMSKFYHLGTTQEYLHGLTRDQYLRRELNLTNIVSSRVSSDSDVSGIVLNCIIDKPISVPEDTVVEYSIITSKVSLGPRTILSNVQIEADVEIPPGFLYHTIPILVSKDGTRVRRYVTVAFHVTDDMKFSTDLAQAENLQYGGKLLSKLFSLAPPLKRSKSSVFKDCSSASLWNAKLFSAHESMSESFTQTVSFVSALIAEECSTSCSPDELFSMQDLVSLKDCQGILEFRKQLNRNILLR